MNVDSDYGRVEFGQRTLADGYDPGLGVVLKVMQAFGGQTVGFDGRIVWQICTQGLGKMTTLTADAQIGRQIEFGLDQLQQHFIQPLRHL